VLVPGLKALVDGAGRLFDEVRLAGAAYLIWIGIAMGRSGGRIAPPRPARARRWSDLTGGAGGLVEPRGAPVLQNADPAVR
jgi:threonine/homoserine/homoserine lactone efflux protein